MNWIEINEKLVNLNYYSECRVFHSGENWYIGLGIPSTESPGSVHEKEFFMGKDDEGCDKAKAVYRRIKSRYRFFRCKCP